MLRCTRADTRDTGAIRTRCISWRRICLDDQYYERTIGTDDAIRSDMRGAIGSAWFSRRLCVAAASPNYAVREARRYAPTSSCRTATNVSNRRGKRLRVPTLINTVAPPAAT